MEVRILLEAQWESFTLETTSELETGSCWLSQPKGAEGRVDGSAQAGSATANRQRGKLSR